MASFEALDKAWALVGGRKFLAWGVTTGLHVAGQVDGYNWMIITLVYIGGQTAIDALAHLKGTKTAPGPQAAVKAAAKKKAAPEGD